MGVLLVPGGHRVFGVLEGDVAGDGRLLGKEVKVCLQVIVLDGGGGAMQSLSGRLASFLFTLTDIRRWMRNLLEYRQCLEEIYCSLVTCLVVKCAVVCVV